MPRSKTVNTVIEHEPAKNKQLVMWRCAYF